MENGEDGKAIIEWDGKEGRSGGAGKSIRRRVEEWQERRKIRILGKLNLS